MRVLLVENRNAREKEAEARKERNGKQRRVLSLDLDGHVLDGRAFAEEVGIPVGVIDSADRRPELLLTESRKRVGGFLSSVGAVQTSKR